MVPRYIALGLLVASIATAGCKPSTTTLHGNVRHGNKPIPSGSVIVYCQGGEIVRGIITEDGSYSIRNVPRGRAVVTVKPHPRVPEGMQLRQKLPPTGPGGPMSPSEGSYLKDHNVTIPRRYANPDESGLAIDVQTSDQEYDIELQS
jgi:hypothetical protein